VERGSLSSSRRSTHRVEQRLAAGPVPGVSQRWCSKAGEQVVNHIAVQVAAYFSQLTNATQVSADALYPSHVRPLAGIGWTTATQHVAICDNNGNIAMWICSSIPGVQSYDTIWCWHVLTTMNRQEPSTFINQSISQSNSESISKAIDGRRCSMSMKNAMNWWHIVSSRFVGGGNWCRLQFVKFLQYIGSMLSMDEKLYTSAQL